MIFNDWLDVGDVASYTFTGLTANRPYTFSLRAKNANGVSSNVNTIANTLDGPNKAPPDPTGLSASNITHSSVTLNWTKSSGATSYEVLVIEFEGEDTDFFDVGDVASYTFTGLTADRTHAFTLRAKNSYGISVAVSLSRSITTLVAPPGWGRSSRSPTATPMFTPSPKPTVHTLKQLPAEIQVNNWLDGAQGRRVGIAEIAQPDIIAQGVLDAVDVFGYVSPGVEVCFSAHGRIVFLDAAYAPRRAFDLSAYQRAGRTCALIDRAGTVVLLRGDSPPPPQNTPPANTNPDGGRGLGECEVRPWANLKVRQEPPDGLVLGVTAAGTGCAPATSGLVISKSTSGKSRAGSAALMSIPAGIAELEASATYANFGGKNTNFQRLPLIALVPTAPIFVISRMICYILGNYRLSTI